MARHTPRRTAVPVLAALALSAAPLRAQQDTVLLEAVIRLDIQHGPTEIILAAAVDSRLLLPLRRLLDLVEVGTASVSEGQFLTAVLQPAGTTVRFDTDSMRLTVGDSVFPLGRFDAIWRDGELFVFTGTLMTALGVEVGVDWGGLIAVVAKTDGLPVARRARRERRQALVLRRSAPVLRGVTAPQRNGLADGAVLDWSLSAATDDPFENSTQRLGAGAKLLGGGLELQFERHGYTGGSVTSTRGSWVRAWPNNRWMRQVRIGDVSTGGRRSRLVRGAVVTNQPFVRSSEFDFEEIVGELEAGWEIELYDSRGLLDFGEADPFGEFRVALPLRYGQNPYDMVLYGPRGEVVRRQRTIRVPFSRIPAGQLEYAVGAGSCRSSEPCGGSITADARYGISNRITAQAGWDLLTRGGGASDLWQPYVALSAAVLPSLRLTTEAVVNGLLRGQVEFEPTPSLRVELAQTFLDADGAFFTGSGIDRRRTEGSMLWYSAGRIPTVVQVTATRASGEGTSRSLLGATGTVRFKSGRYAFDIRHARVTQPSAPRFVQTSVGLSGDVVLGVAPLWLRTATVGGAIRMDAQRGFSVVRASLGRAIGRVVRVDLGLGWFRDQGGLALELGLSTTMPGPRFGSRNRFTTDGANESIQFVDGSVRWDRASGRVHVGDGRDLGRAGLTGLVFLDIDADGTHDADEPGLEGVPVRIDGWTMVTDATGRFSTWELFPFEVSMVAVDTTGLASPFYVVPNRVLEVTPTPNSYSTVEIPVVVGAEVSGGVLYGGRPLSGVRIEIRNLTTDRVVALTTFTDGGFYVIGIPPGEYEASVPAKILEGIGARSAPVRFTVPTGRGEKTIDALVLTVENGNGG